MTASQSLIISSPGGAATPVAVFQSETQAVMARAFGREAAAERAKGQSDAAQFAPRHRIDL